jgi:uncharacterized protein (TIGR02246 family)
MRSTIAAALLFLSATAFANEKKEQRASAQDMEQIRSLAQNVSQAWNQHDSAQMSKYWTQNGSFLTMDGQLLKGRDQIERQFQKDHADHLKNTNTTITVTSVRMIRPGVALVDSEQRITGMAPPKMQQGQGGSGSMPMPEKFHVTALLVKEGNQWLLSDVRPGVSMDELQRMGTGGAGMEQQPGQPPRQQQKPKGGMQQGNNPPSGY